jgi:hypothetical protein
LRLGFVGVAVGMLHLLVYTPLLWLLAGWLLGILRAIHNRKLRAIVAATMVIALLAIGFAPIHGIGHDRVSGKSAYGLYLSLLTKHTV